MGGVEVKGGIVFIKFCGAERWICVLMASSSPIIFSTYRLSFVSVLLLWALISPSPFHHQIVGFLVIAGDSKPGNMSLPTAMAMAIEEEDEDSMAALLPFGFASKLRIGSFRRLPQCVPIADQSSPQNFVDAHNAARAQVGVGPVQWGGNVASFSQLYAKMRINDCELVHTNGPYGENLAWSSSNLTETEAVELWVSEKQYYDYTSNSCDSGKVCGHYTQVVWRDSVRIGCAKVTCTSGGTIIICNYAPPGNLVGERPY